MIRGVWSYNCQALTFIFPIKRLPISDQPSPVVRRQYVKTGVALYILSALSKSMDMWRIKLKI